MSGGILGDVAIREAIRLGDIQVGGIESLERALQPASVDLTLGRSFCRFVRRERHPLFGGPPLLDFRDANRPPEVEARKFEAGEVSLDPGEFILASTEEYISLSALYAARVEGRSSVGRLGLLTHLTAGFIDPGFAGRITLELLNVSGCEMILPAGFPIAQIAFFKADRVARPYGRDRNHYLGQHAATPSRLVTPYRLGDGGSRVYADGARALVGED